MEEFRLKNNYIKILEDGKLKGDCGGNQDWFKQSSFVYAAAQGCGMVAAIDVCFYINDSSTVSWADYLGKVKSFIKNHSFARLFLHEFKRKGKTIVAVGIVPGQICGELNKNCKINNIPYVFKWNGIHGHKGLYEKIKWQIMHNVPVIWSIYKPGQEKLALYKYDSNKGDYVRACGVNNHYLTAIGIVETTKSDGRLRRMIKVSSWGKSYYINFDEYLEFEGNGLLNQFCSNIVSVKL